MKKLTLSLFTFFFLTMLSAQIRTANVFTDSMVLQRGKPIPVWGWAGKQEEITVQFHQQTKKTIAGDDGKWFLKLETEKEGGPYALTVTGKTTKTLNDIWVGDVWLCSGQSNMEFTVNSAMNSKAEIAAANYPMIRHVQVKKEISSTPKTDISETNWHTASPAYVAGFTAVGYYFAREVFKETNIPIGLLHSSWGGTDVETWTSREAFAASEEFKEMINALPVVNLDSLANIKAKTMMEAIKKFQPSLPKAAEINKWKEPSYNDQQWPVMAVPGLWEDKVLPEVDGVVWFRTTVTINAADAGKAATLNMGMIDDNDISFVNGTRIGNTNGYNIKRVYPIPAGILKAGNNLIAIRIDDTGGGGGLYGDAKDLNLTIGNNSIPLAGNWSFQVATLGRSATVGPNSYPSLLFNAMINPLVPFAIKGVLWYQGESNAGRAFQYRKAFPLMITDWRRNWKQGGFPFYFVQLASFNSANGNSVNGSNWAELREAQTKTLGLLRTGMAVTTDIGEANDIHPKNKQDVGKRLAAIALHYDYGKQGEFMGPLYQSMKIEGNKVSISFTHTGKGLMTKASDEQLKGFEIAGSDKQFFPATATIEGDKVIVSSDKVSAPASVHFGWADDAGICNLFNKDGFPASPFRTDNWSGKTDQVKYRKP